jgi:hypothetical protein
MEIGGEEFNRGSSASSSLAAAVKDDGSSRGDPLGDLARGEGQELSNGRGEDVAVGSEDFGFELEDEQQVSF